MSKLITLTGSVGSGKDLVATIIQDEVAKMGLTASTFALADQPKRIAGTVFNLPINVFYDRDKKDTVLSEYGKTPRELLLSLYDWLFDTYGSDFSLRHNSTIIEQKKNEFDVVIVTDCRYDVEVKLFLSQGADSVYVDRPNNPHVDGEDVHNVERLKKQSTKVIMNDGSVDDLRESILSYINEW